MGSDDPAVKASVIVEWSLAGGLLSAKSLSCMLMEPGVGKIRRGRNALHIPYDLYL